MCGLGLRTTLSLAEQLGPVAKVLESFHTGNRTHECPRFDKKGGSLRLINITREKGVSAFIDDGLNRWAAVHRLDAAHLYRLVLEKGSGVATYHAVADEGIPTREIAQVIGRCLNVPVVSKSREKAADHFGWIAHFFGMDGAASSAQTQKELGWRPQQPGLIADLDRPSYFTEASLSASR
jgi:nucleoside-diphosphate-sugar epimerase